MSKDVLDLQLRLEQREKTAVLGPDLRRTLIFASTFVQLPS
jgi:hypothetical protein